MRKIKTALLSIAIGSLAALALIKPISRELSVLQQMQIVSEDKQEEARIRDFYKNPEKYIPDSQQKLYLQEFDKRGRQHYAEMAKNWQWINPDSPSRKDKLFLVLYDKAGEACAQAAKP